MIGLLAIGAIALLVLSNKRSVSGIGATPKRRLYAEISRLQPTVDFNLDYDKQSPGGKRAIQENCRIYYNEKYPKRQPISPERYYKQLKRAYNAISGIGKTNLPYQESKVKNDYGDVILIYRDYGTEQQKLRDAINYIDENYNTNDFEIGYWNALLAIATGYRFVWPSKGVHRGLEELIFGHSAPKERKARISYLASPEKGGIYPEPFIETIKNENRKAVDEMELLDGMLDAFRAVESVKQAKKSS
jgi:hypothetical protein